MTKTRARSLAGLTVLLITTTAALIWLAALQPELGDQLRNRFQSHWPVLPSPAAGQSGPLGTVSVRVDPQAVGPKISPLIYGVAGADPQVVRALGATLDRWGGNPSSTYNWANGHAWNAGRDWEFRNTNYSGQGGSAADAAVGDARSAGAVPLLTVPTLGFVARNDDNQTRSRNVPGQGGPPLRAGSPAIGGYDPTANRQATSLPSFARKPGPLIEAPNPNSQAVYQNEWVHHLVAQFGLASGGGVQYYAMDNEPDLWSTSHTDLHPTRMSYEDMLANFEEYASMVKELDPGAEVLGPDVSGWTGYMYSDLDRGSDNFATHADRTAHGGDPFLAWWLGQVARADAARGQRTLGLLDVHYYPQAEGVFSQASDPATQALRIRSVRSLYDRDYRDESWIDEQVALIPRLKDWINQRYPGTGLAITEYNWGGERDASGAVALAEVLGTFGREGVQLASYWTYPPPDSPAGAAFRLYRNYDGQGGVFGDVSLPAAAGDSAIAAYAARHSDGGEVDVILANQSTTQPARVSVATGGGTYHATQFAVSPGSSRIQPSAMASPGTTVTLPPLGLSLVRLTPG
jgi:Glycoside hydrolase family 44